MVENLEEHSFQVLHVEVLASIKHEERGHLRVPNDVTRDDLSNLVVLRVVE